MRTLSVVDGRFVLDGQPTYSRLAGFPDADPRLLGLLLNHRVVNGIFDDHSPDRDYDGDGRDDWAFPDTGEWSKDRNTHLFLEAMHGWREHGVIAFTIGLQGGNPFVTGPPPAGLKVSDLDCGAFTADGGLRRSFMVRLEWILEEAERLDMVPIVNYFYQGGAHRIEHGELASAVENATQWLLEHGRGDLIIDLANECDIKSYPEPLQPDRIHELMYVVKDVVALHVQRTGKDRRFLVGASFGGNMSDPERIAAVPESFFRTVDLLLPHGNSRTTDEIIATIKALRQRAGALARRQLPIVFNEDIVRHDADAEDFGGDLEHLEACLDRGVSWGNLIRSHQRVPCTDWLDGSDVQRAWFRRTSQLAGKANPPSSVRRHYHHIRAL